MADAVGEGEGWRGGHFMLAPTSPRGEEPRAGRWWAESRPAGAPANSSGRRTNRTPGGMAGSSKS